MKARRGESSNSSRRVGGSQICCLRDQGHWELRWGAMSDISKWVWIQQRVGKDVAGYKFSRICKGGCRDRALMP
jgi:hypothetical protein